MRTILETHPLTRPLIPEKTTEWASNKFTINRNAIWRDPSVWAAGLFSNITGARADVIVCDDVEVPNTCESAEARADLRDRLAETEFILNPGGTMMYIGTPHCYETIYADAPRTEMGEDDIFLKDYARLSIPLLNDAGESAWPERFTTKAIERQKKQVGPMRFAAQMMLTPVNITESRLDPAQLHRYDAALENKVVQDKLYLSLHNRNIVSCGAWWDPAFASAKGDASVLAVVFNDDEGNRYLHHVEYIKVPAGNEAQAQCAIVAEIAAQFFIPSIEVETNGIGKFLPDILRNVLSERRVPCAVHEVTSSRAKDLRILEGFDAVMAARALYVHESVYQTPFIREMSEWRPGLKGARDDGLDAAAGALSLKPAKLRRFHFVKRHSWQGGQTQARTDFPL